MRLFTLVLLFGPMIGLAAEGEREASIRAFNANFVAWLHDDKPLAKEFAATGRSSSALELREALRKSPGVYFLGHWDQAICRFFADMRLCWSPVFEGSKFGFRFAPNGETHWLKAKDEAGMKRELQALFKSPKVAAWWSPLPEAIAQPAFRVSPHLHFDHNAVLATAAGWRRVFDSSAPKYRLTDNIATWEADYVANKSITCKEGGATLARPRSENTVTLTRLQVGEYLANIGGTNFKVQLVRASNSRQCQFLTRDLDGCIPGTGDELIARGTEQSYQHTPAPGISSRVVICRKATIRRCEYQLPEETMQVDTCGDAECKTTKPAEGQERLLLFNASAKELSQLDDLLKKMRDIKADVQPGAKDLGIDDAKSTLTGEQIVKLRDLNKQREGLLEAIKPFTRMAEFQEDLIRLEVASECCKSAECRANVFSKTNINMKPKPQNPAEAER